MKKTKQKQKIHNSYRRSTEIKRTRYLIHRAFKQNKINQIEWMNLLNQNYQSDRQGRFIIIDYINSLDIDRVIQPRFKKYQFVKLLLRESTNGFFMVLIMFLIWIFFYFIRSL